jgi:hypothetical protein
MRRITVNPAVVCLTVSVVAAFFACNKGDRESVENETGRTVLETSGADYALWRGYISVLDINFRTEPSADATRLKGREVLYWGVEFDVLTEEDDWVLVRLDDGTEGWLRAEYEGNVYVKDVADLADPSGLRRGANRPIDSAEFLEMADAAAEEWQPFYNELDLLCGSYGALNGECYEWTAFYTALHSDKKLWCSFRASDPGDGFRTEEWDTDWEWHGGVPKDDAGVAPGPAWWHYEDTERLMGFVPISTAEMCKPANLDEMIAAAKREMPVDLGSVAEDYGGFDFALDFDRWLVGVPTHTDSYYFYFDARSGEFLEFELVEFEGR